MYWLITYQPTLSQSCRVRLGLQCSFQTTCLEVGRRDLLLPFDFLFLSAVFFLPWQQKLVPVSSFCHSQNELGLDCPSPILLGRGNPYFLCSLSPRGGSYWLQLLQSVLIISVPFALAVPRFPFNQIPCIKSSLLKCLVRFLFFWINPDTQPKTPCYGICLHAHLFDPSV